MKKIIVILVFATILGFQSNSQAFYSNFAFGKTMFEDKFGQEVMEPTKKVILNLVINQGAAQATTQYQEAKKEGKDQQKIEDTYQEALGRNTIKHWSDDNINCLMIANIEEEKFDLKNAITQIKLVKKEHPNATDDFIIEECVKNFSGNDVEKSQHAFNISYALYKRNLWYGAGIDVKKSLDAYRRTCRVGRVGNFDYDEAYGKVHSFEDYKTKANEKEQIFMPAEIESSFHCAREKAKKELNPS